MSNFAYNNFSFACERVEQREQGQTTMLEVVNGDDMLAESTDDMSDILHLENAIRNNNVTIADDLEVSAMTQEDINAIESRMDMFDILHLENVIRNNNVTIADDREGSAMTQEDINAIEECQEEIEISSVKEKDLVLAQDDSSGKVSTEGAPGLIKGKAQQDISCQPYVICQKILQEYDLCYLDANDCSTKLCMFNGTFWQEMDEEALRQLVYNTLPHLMKEGTNAIESLAGHVVDYIRREVKKEYDEGKKRFSAAAFNRVQNRIVFQNCVYDVKEGKKYKFSSKKPYSYQINCHYVDENLPTPFYDKLKRDATGGDKESMDMIDYMIAYLLLPNRTGKCFFVMSPARDSGKNVLGEFIERLFDRRLVRTMDTDFLGDGKFSREGFDTVRLATCLEMPVRPLKTAAVKELKTFTGNSSMEVQGKYVKRIDSQVEFKVLLATNGGVYLPPGEMDEAFFRRVISIPFIRSTPMDQLVFNLPQLLYKERSAIVSKCVRSFKKVFSEDGGIVFPESELSKELKGSWMGKSFFNEAFAANMLEYTAFDNDAILKEDLMSVYNEYYNAEVVNGVRFDKPVHCSQDALIKVISSVYPGAYVTRRRRKSIISEEDRNAACVIGVRWTDAAWEIIRKCKVFYKESLEDNKDEL